MKSVQNKAEIVIDWFPIRASMFGSFWKFRSFLEQYKSVYHCYSVLLLAQVRNIIIIAIQCFYDLKFET